MERFELLTPCLQGRCSPNWATPPRMRCHLRLFLYISCFFSMGSRWLSPMGLSGLEPPTSRLSGVRSNQLSYKPIFEIFRFQWRWRDSNSRPPACKAGALPTELHPHLIWHPPALPHRLQCSTIGRLRLNRRVRDGNGCFPQAHRYQKCLFSYHW